MTTMTHPTPVPTHHSIPATEVRPGDILLPEKAEVVAVEIKSGSVVFKYTTKGAPVYAGKSSIQEVLR